MTTLRVVLLSGSLRPGSTSDRVIAWCADRCAERGAVPYVFTGSALDLPFYRSGVSQRHAGARALVDALAAADAVVLVSPAYHGTVSGLLKNALDYVNDISGARPFLDGRPIGCVAISAGPQGGASTLATLRTIAHAVRGWPTPLGVVLDSARPVEAPETAEDHRRGELLREMLSQVLHLGSLRPGSGRDNREASLTGQLRGVR